MSDSKELDEILNEIKNMKNPKPENDEPQITEPQNAEPQIEEPQSEEKFTVEETDNHIDENIDFDSFSNFNQNNVPEKIDKEEPEMANKKKPNAKLIAIIAVIVVVIIAVVVGVLLSNSKKTDEPTSTTPATSDTVSEETTETPVSTANPLTGSTDFNSEAVGKRPIACVVENAAAARPQWGIDDSDNPPDIIVEGEVEGGETRMLFMYADYTAVPSQIGPMRSARPPFIKFSELFDSIFLHWGMSRTKKGTDYIGANTVFRVDEVDHIDQMTYSGSISLFGRDSSRNVSSEHTGVLYGDKIADAIIEQNFRTEADSEHYTKFNFADEEIALSDTNCNNLNLTFSSRTATREWTYNSDDKMYHCTDYSTDVARKNLLVLFDSTEYVSKANYKNSGSAEVYCNYLLSGGTGKLASNGTVVDITWSVDNGILSVKDASGADVTFNVGTTWIGYASSNNGGSVTAE